MEFDEWNPVYRAILADFGYDRADDERARDVLADLLGDAGTFPLERLQGPPTTVAVAGAGPSLYSDADEASEADLVFAASTAADRLTALGVDVDLVVTDLDKHGNAVVDFTQRDVPVAVHAHGDNVSLLREHVPDCEFASLVPTTQAAPAGPVRNFGGFTDGDRAAFLADHLDAAELTFPGWDLDDPDVGPEKARKLRWAERLLYWLERRRGDRFAVLDGRRDAVDTAGLPVD